MGERFIGYRFEHDGKHDGKHWLDSPDEVWRFMLTNMLSYPEVMITDGGDFCVLEAKNGKIVYPPECVEKLYGTSVGGDSDAIGSS